MILGKVNAIHDYGLSVLIDGETKATTKAYTFLSSYSPVVGDRVLIAEVSGQYVILGKIVSNPADAGTAYAVSAYSGGEDLRFTIHNDDLWVRQRESGTQFALQKKG